MAVVYPVSGNNCVGNYADGTVWIKKKCVKGQDDQGDDIITCAQWRYFYVTCPKLNRLCSTTSGAWVAANTVCQQRLW